MDLNKEDLTKKLILQTAFHWFSLSSLTDSSLDGIRDKTWTLILFKFAAAEAADFTFYNTDGKIWGPNILTNEFKLQ